MRDFDFSDFASDAVGPALLPRAVEAANGLHPALRSIALAELQRGNRIVAVGEDYPEPGSICVTLRERFDDRYDTSASKFSLCHDPHYWHASYETTGDPPHLLIC